jgi:hypothetical protein
MPGAADVERVDNINLGAVGRDKLLAPGQASIFLVLSAHNVDLPSQLTDTEVPPFRFHGPNGKEAVLNRPA